MAAEQERRQREQAERDQAERDCRAAAHVRHGYLCELITGQIRIDPDMIEAITRYAATIALTSYPEPDLTALATLLGQADTPTMPATYREQEAIEAIAVVAAARKQLELVFYALRDHHVRSLQNLQTGPGRPRTAA